MRSLASSAQNHIGCSKTVVTSRHFETPPPTPPWDTLSQKFQALPLWSVKSFMDDLYIALNFDPRNGTWEFFLSSWICCCQLWATLMERLHGLRHEQKGTAQPNRIQSLCYCFLCQQKKKSPKKTGGPGLYCMRLMLKLKWKRERSQMQQCQKGKLQEIKEATYHGSRRRGDISRNLGVLLYRQSTAPNARILFASQRAHNACRLSKELDYLVRKL